MWLVIPLFFITSQRGMADLALCPFRFNRVKTVFFFERVNIFTIFHRRFHWGWFDSEAIRFFQGSSEILARVRRDNFTWGGLQVSFGARPIFSGEVLVSGEGNWIRNADTTYSKVPDKTWIEISSSSSKNPFLFNPRSFEGSCLDGAGQKWRNYYMMSMSYQIILD